MARKLFILQERKNGVYYYKSVFSNLTKLHKYLLKSHLLYYYDYQNVQHSLDSYSSFYRKFKITDFIAFEWSNGRDKKNMEVITDWLNRETPG